MRRTTIWINGRFLGRKVTGVERVACEILNSLAEHYLDAEGRYTTENRQLQFKIVLDQRTALNLPDFARHWEVKRTGRFQGHAWEQFDLARFQPQDWLLNLCNTAPLWRRRQAVFFHDAQVYAIPENFSWKFRFWYRALLRIAGRRSRLLFTNSHFSQAELSRYTGIRREKFRVIHLGSDHMQRLRVESPRALLEKLNGAPFVLAVSSSSPNKNFQGVLNALQSMGQGAPHCVIVGQKYTRVFNSVSLSDQQVSEMGYVSDEQLAGLYQQAMCLIYPSLYEGFGLPPLEAMQMSCPVIVSQRAALPEVCGDAAFYCDPQAPESIAAAIRELQAYPDLPALRAKNRQHAQQFTWQKSAGKLLSALCQNLD